ncbi:MAG: hypothetical protein AAF742_01430 [Pseudomonadota bacterium]
MDAFVLSLMVASVVICISRYVSESPPAQSYLLVAIGCGVGNWVSEGIDELAGVAIIVAAFGLFLSCVIYPHLHQTLGNLRFGSRKKDDNAGAL